MKRQEKFEDYDSFVEKFKTKKTTDDCYTPPELYNEIKKWACNYYGLDEKKIVRPFYPGGDYEKFEYPEGAIVLDNPPFSILAKIIDFYLERKISFFLFAPAMTLFSTIGSRNVNGVITSENIIYSNGAKVQTAFVTSLGDYAIDVNLELNNVIKEINAAKEKKKKIPKYSYPKEVLMMGDLLKISRGNLDMKIKREDIAFIRELEQQRPLKKTLYGGGFLTTPNIAVEKCNKLEKVKQDNFFEWELSKKEKNIIKNLQLTR